ncbi:MAG: PQQ-binding-like beta-propeller repeat protein [Acidobacteriota bacterium]|nr:PQQ-binding-like beta-propeller repeat protein [Acidobacteriota bacterium]
MTAVLICGWARPAAAQSSAIFPLDHFWTHALDAPFAAGPAADAARVYVPLSTGQLVALAPGLAAPIWSVELAADATPVAADGRLFVSAAGAIHALDGATGSVVWRLPAGPLAAPLVHRAGWLVVALADGAVQAVRASDGVVVWARTLPAPLAAAAAADDNALAVALSNGRVLLMVLETGATRWERPLGAPAAGVTLDRDRLFVGTSDGFFWSLRAHDGSLDWRWRLGAKPVGAPAVDPERVYVAALDNIVRGFSRNSGNVRWSYTLPTRPLSGPALVDGLLVLASGAVGLPGLTYVNSRTGAAAGNTPALPSSKETTRSQFPVIITGGAAPRAFVATATTSGDWEVHGYRQTFLSAVAGAWLFGPLYDIRLRLEYAIGIIRFGSRVTLPLPPPPLPPA